MSLVAILQIVPYAVLAIVVLAIGSVVIQIIIFCRTDKLPEKVASRLVQVPAPSSVEQSEAVQSESSALPSQSVSHSHEVTIDNDYDIAFMSRSLYQYFLECEKKVMEARK